MNLFKTGVSKYGHRDYSSATGGKIDMGLNSESVVYAWLDSAAAPKVNILYYDRMQSANPIVIVTDETSLDTLASYSNQLYPMTVEKKNGVAYSPNEELVINLDRVILAYEDGDGTDDYVMWYDKSRTNMAQIDSPHVDILTVDENLASINTFFIRHLGGKAGLIDLESINVNGRLIDFPAKGTASGLIRTVNISTVQDDSNDSLGGSTTGKAHITMSALGQGWQRIITNETITQLLTRNEVALTT